jgi:hypothetical protein
MVRFFSNRSREESGRVVREYADGGILEELAARIGTEERRLRP